MKKENQVIQQKVAISSLFTLLGAICFSASIFNIFGGSYNIYTSVGALIILTLGLIFTVSYTLKVSRQYEL